MFQDEGRLGLPWVDAQTMSLFLQEVAQRHADEFVFMVMDQTGRHIASELLVPLNMRLMFLPRLTASNATQPSTGGRPSARTASPASKLIPLEPGQCRGSNRSLPYH
jgi:hypothetical protein